MSMLDFECVSWNGEIWKWGGEAWSSWVVTCMEWRGKMPSAGGMRRDLGRGFRHQHDLYQISYALWCWKQRVEGKRKERDEKRKEGFAHQWSFFSSVRTQVGRLLCEVIGMFVVASCGREEPLVSRVRTQLMCGEDTTVSSLPNYRLRISSQTPSVVPILFLSPFFSILKILFTPFSFKIFGGRGAIEGQWQDPPVWRQEDEVGKNSHHRATHIIIQRK